MTQGTEARDGVALMVVVPHASASTSFRAYAALIGNRVILTWILERLRLLAPPAAPTIVVCDCDAELERVVAAAGDGQPGVAFRSLPRRNEMQQCRAVMDEFRTAHLLVAGFGHAVAPDRLLRDLYQLHIGCSAALSEATGGTFTDSCYAVHTALIDRFVTTTLHNPAVTTLRAATGLRQEARIRGESVPDFLWIQSDVGARYRLPPETWPEAIGVTSGRDVEILEQALTSPIDKEGAGLITTWKHAAIVTRRRRLTSTSGVMTPVHEKPGSRRKGTRVLYASHMSSFTGAQQSLCHLIGGLAERYETRALVSYEGTFTTELRRRGVAVICPNHSIGRNDPENLVFARNVIRECAPDLIHLNHSIGMPFVCAAMAAGVPIVQHVRIPDLETLREHVAAADAIIAVSQFIKQRIAALDVPSERIHVIWNGVLSEELTPNPQRKAPSREQLGVPAGEFVVALIARMSRKKRHDTVISAMSRLRRVTGRGHLLLVGDYDSDLPYIQELDALIQKEGLAPFMTRIEFISDIRPVLYASDALVLPSEDEPLARAVLEGMAVGLPVVVGDSGGSQELIDSGTTGFVVGCADFHRLSELLTDLAEDPALAQRVGAAAAAKVQTTLTAAVCATRTAEVYERVLGQHSISTKRSAADSASSMAS